MKQPLKLIALVLAICGVTSVIAQTGNIKTVFKNGTGSAGGYGAVANKLTSIHGNYANIPGFYGGWYLNHQFMLGLGLAASANNIQVPAEYSTNPLENRSWQYGQFGLMTEYVLDLEKPVHLVFQLFGGAGFTLQYQRFGSYHQGEKAITSKNWFTVMEPAVQLEINLFKWMRLSPGVSYRAIFGSDAPGLTDRELSDISYNATLKFGRF